MPKKFMLILSFLCLSSVLLSFTSTKQKILKTIIIDAGHGRQPNGGYDGAKGSYSF